MNLRVVEGRQRDATVEIETTPLATTVGSGDLDVLSTSPVLALAEGLCKT